MQGVLLESGNVDRYLALGKSGQPVFAASEQILAALQRHPDLLNFFAVPQRNEKGSVIDWYSPVKGHVIPWNQASDTEKSQAKEILQKFCDAVQKLGAQQAQGGQSKGNTDRVLFGELLQESCKVPSASNIYLIERDGATKRSTELNTVTNLLQSTDSGNPETGAESTATLQPVLTFWGFVNSEADRRYRPLHFLEPVVKAPVAAAVAQAPVSALSAAPATPVPVAENPHPVVPVAVAKKPWWKGWWWLLLLLLLLLLAWLLRGCMPTARLPGMGGMPSLPKVGLPEVSLPEVNLSTQLPEVELPGVAVPAVNGVPGLGLPEGSLPSGGMGLPEGGVPGAAEDLPEGAAGVASPSRGEQPQEQGTPPEQPAPTPPTLPEGNAQAPEDKPAAPAQPEPLQIPNNAPDGVADFLNGNYQTRGGLMDKDTAQPLRLQYAFENGKGNVQIQRSNGVSCQGQVNAAMSGGQLGISSEGAAKCSDGTSYDMPQVNCKAGAKSIADCMGAYGSNQFPIQMQTR